MGFDSHIVADFCQEVGSEIPDLVMSYRGIASFGAREGMLDRKGETPHAGAAGGSVL